MSEQYFCFVTLLKRYKVYNQGIVFHIQSRFIFVPRGYLETTNHDLYRLLVTARGFTCYMDKKSNIMLQVSPRSVRRHGVIEPHTPWQTYVFIILVGQDKM